MKLVKSYPNRLASDRTRKMYPALGKIAKKHFDDSFKQEGFTDVHFEKWATRVGNRRPKDRILYETGKLSRSNEWRIISGGIQVYNDTPYGYYHNKGINQVQRKYMGNSYELNRKSAEVIRSVVLKSFSRK
ncbi:MAG: hypothetical protein AAF620_00320 [Bacteroidota bacterium]